MTWKKRSLSFLSSLCIPVSIKEEDDQMINTRQHGGQKMQHDVPPSYISTAVQTVNPPEPSGIELGNLHKSTIYKDHEAHASTPEDGIVSRNMTSTTNSACTEATVRNTYAVSTVAQRHREGTGRSHMAYNGPRTVEEEAINTVLPRSEPRLEESTFGRASMLAIADNSSDTISLYSSHTDGARMRTDTKDEVSVVGFISHKDRGNKEVGISHPSDIDAPYFSELGDEDAAGLLANDTTHPERKNEKLQEYLNILEEAKLPVCDFDTVNVSRQRKTRLQHPAESDGTDFTASLAVSRTTPALNESSFTSLDVLTQLDLDKKDLLQPEAQVVKVYRVNEWTKYLGEATAPQAQRWSFIKRDSEYVEEECVRVLSSCFSYVNKEVQSLEDEHPSRQTWRPRALEKAPTRRPAIPEDPPPSRECKPALRHFSSLQDMPRMQWRSSETASSAQLQSDCNLGSLLPKGSEHQVINKSDKQPLTKPVSYGTASMPSRHSTSIRSYSPYQTSCLRSAGRTARLGGHVTDSQYSHLRCNGKEMTLPERRRVLRYASHEALRSDVFQGSLVPVVDGSWLNRAEEQGNVLRRRVDNHQRRGTRHAEASSCGDTMPTFTKRSVFMEHADMRKAMTRSVMQNGPPNEPRILDVCDENSRNVQDAHRER